MNTRPFTERRVRRSSEPATALELQLEWAKDNGRLEAVVLADSQGFVLAAAGAKDVCEALGALAPLAPRVTVTGCMNELVGGADVAVRALRSNGLPFFLAALGGTSARDALLARAASGVQRILVTN